MVELLSENPAKVFGIYPQKGTIRVGADGDFTVFNFDHEIVVDKNKNYSHARNIALVYEGWRLGCQLTYTFVRGRAVMKMVLWMRVQKHMET